MKVLLAGLIPACAGKTGSSPSSMDDSTAHPRVCGENLKSDLPMASQYGSSPRVRGKPPRCADWRDSAGLIPACAGKTSSTSRTHGSRRAHPRVCGENQTMIAGGPLSDGSSPRVRGKPRVVGVGAPAAGLIPACAGKTVLPGPGHEGRAAHPRVCGENSSTSRFCCPGRGSSPRVRGKRPRCPGGTCPGQAHPRVCGENGRQERSKDEAFGSSPRVRGKHFLTRAFTAQAGQILETLGPSAFSGSYSFPGARANGGQCRARRRGLCTGPALGRPLGAS